jgi:hypothetical protein
LVDINIDLDLAAAFEHIFFILQEDETEKIKNYANKKANELKRLDTMLVSFFCFCLFVSLFVCLFVVVFF